MKILINAANLHVGGGVQVATSFITELAILMKREKINASLIYSTMVKSNLSAETDLSFFDRVDEINLYGIKLPSKENRVLFDGYDVCFTIFGPLYFQPKVKKHICGFAQPWIAYPDNDVYPKLAFIDRCKLKLKFYIQSLFFKKYNMLVVEQEHIKDALSCVGFLKEKITVVSNCVSTIYDNPELWGKLEFDKSCLKNSVTLGFIGRAYKHKNIEIFKQVNQILLDEYDLKCNFIFTFSQNEMISCGFSGLDNFFSVGSIKVEQCPEFYQLLDALVFPSLLECFSASPIEAMKMNTTVFASNYPFVTEVCKDAAFYFDALDARAIARTIFIAFQDKNVIERKRALGFELVQGLPNAKDRALSYLHLIYN